MATLLFVHAFKVDDVLGQTNRSEQAYDEECHVELPPLMAVLRQAWMSMVVIVPAFTVSDDRDPPKVATVVTRFVVLVAPDM